MADLNQVIEFGTVADDRIRNRAAIYGNACAEFNVVADPDCSDRVDTGEFLTVMGVGDATCALHFVDCARLGSDKGKPVRTYDTIGMRDQIVSDLSACADPDSGADQSICSDTRVGGCRSVCLEELRTDRSHGP